MLLPLLPYFHQGSYTVVPPPSLGAGRGDRTLNVGHSVIYVDGISVTVSYSTSVSYFSFLKEKKQTTLFPCVISCPHDNEVA